MNFSLTLEIARSIYLPKLNASDDMYTDIKSAFKNFWFYFFNQSHEKMWLMLNSFLNECFPKTILLWPSDTNFTIVILRSTLRFKNYFLLSYINYAAYYIRHLVIMWTQSNLASRYFNILNTIKYVVH